MFKDITSWFVYLWLPLLGLFGLISHKLKSKIFKFNKKFYIYLINFMLMAQESAQYKSLENVIFYV